MKYIKRMLILTMVMLTLVGMAGVCASDVNDTAMASDNADQAIEEVNDDALSEMDEVALSSSQDEIIKQTDNGTFTALQEKIKDADEGSMICLENNYTYDDGFSIDGITISKPLIIDGNGFTIDGDNQARIFNVDDSNVVFMNIIFVNGDATNCEYINDNSNDGGAINGGGIAINCIFTNNKAWAGGAMAEGFAKNCTFSNNEAEIDGGAMAYGEAVNCIFNNNEAEFEGGAIYDGSAVNCTFNSNCASDGGAMAYGYAENCTFNNNSATEGGATHETDTRNCEFNNNTEEIEDDGENNNGNSNGNDDGNQIGDDVPSVSGSSKSYDVSSIHQWNSALSSNQYDNVVINLKSNIMTDEDTICPDLDPSIKTLTIEGNGKTFDANDLIFLKVMHDAEITVRNIRVINGWASYGGAIYNFGVGKLTVVNCIFENNHAIRYGGVIYNSGHNSIIKNCTFRNNYAEKGLDSTGMTILGGAIYNDGDNVTITGNIFESNYVKTTAYIDDRTIQGGAIYSGAYNVKITGNIFIKNSADNGAAIYTYGDDILIDSNTFKLNQAVSAKRNDPIIYMYRGGYYSDVSSGNTFVTDTECYSTIFHYTYYGHAAITNNVFDDRLNTIIETSANRTFPSEYNANNYVVITLKDETGEVLKDIPLRIDFNGVKRLTTDGNGQIKLSTNGMSPNVYNAKVTFAGDDNYAGSTVTFQVTVKKPATTADPGKPASVEITIQTNQVTAEKATPIITAKKATFKVKTKVKKYAVTLKTNKNKAMKGVKIYLKVKGKTYTAKTNSKGKAIFKIKNLKKKGTYKATVTFKGNGNYNKVSKTVKIKIK